MRLLLIGDLHLTDNPRDSYRFDIFEWVRKQQKKFSPTHTVFMGDLTDKKDKHSSYLVNKIADGLYSLDPSYIIKGNHDYIDEDEPFFNFLNKIEGIGLVTEPFKLNGVAFIPHTRDEAAFVKACAQYGQKIVLIHQTITGAVAESGTRLSGFSAAPIEALGPGTVCYAGDIHRPQRIGVVTYVGSPYTIRFGDDFEPRCLLVSPEGKKNLYFDCPRKWSLTISNAKDISLNNRLLEKDQVKVTLELEREEASEARTYMKQVREACLKKGLELYGLEIKMASNTKKSKSVNKSGTAQTPEEIILAFSKREGLPPAVEQAGLDLLKSSKPKGATSGET